MLDLYCVYDKKAQVFNQPLFMPSGSEGKVQAIRAFDQLVNQSGTMVNKYPGDFALYFIGSYEPTTGRFTQPEMLRIEVEAMSFVADVIRREALPKSADQSEPPKVERS